MDERKHNAEPTQEQEITHPDEVNQSLVARAIEELSSLSKWVRDRLGMGPESEQDAAQISQVELAATREIKEIYDGIDAASLISKDAEGYEETDDGVLPTVVKAGTTAKYVEKNSLTSRNGNQVEIYTHPTEPYQAKKDFLEKNGVAQAKNILTILGANWPALYAELTGGKSNVVALDQNPKQIEFLKALIGDKNKFAKMIVDNNFDFATRQELPYYPAISRTIQGSWKNPKTVYSFSSQDKQAENYRKVRGLLKKMSREGRISALNCDLEDLERDGDLGKVDYVDLSNVPELIGPELTQQFLSKMPEGSSAYMSFITHRSESFLTQMQGWDVVDSEDSGKVQFVLMKKVEAEQSTTVPNPEPDLT